mgnify:CR=1 FL=1
MTSEVKVDKLSQKGSTGIVITDDIKLSSGKSIKNAAGTDLLTQAGVLDNVSLGSGVTGKVTLGTVVATTSGNTIVFTGIPTGTRRITVSFGGVSNSGASTPVIQLGDSGGFETSGYLGSGIFHGSSTNTAASITIGLALVPNWNAAVTLVGAMVISLVDPLTNTWVSTSFNGRTDNTTGYSGGSSKSLSGELTQIRLTTSAGDTAWDAGKINIIYE